MKNPYQNYPAIITKVVLDAKDTRAFTLRFLDKKSQAQFKFIPGQFVMVGLSGIGEIPLGIGSPPFEKKFFQITVRAVGRVSRAIHQKDKGAVLFVRGPYGNGWPMNKIKQKNLLVVAGGLGIVPLKPLIDEACRGNLGKNKQVQIFYGSRSFDNLLYESQYKKWCRYLDTKIILDAASRQWEGEIGRIPDIITRSKILTNPVVAACGPPILYKFLIPQLLKKGIKEEDIYLSLERKMYCAVGVCEHCAIGSQYVCKDGPIFSLAQIRKMPDAI